MQSAKIDPMSFISANIFLLKLMRQWFNEHSLGSVDYWRYMFEKQLFLLIVFYFPICGEIIYLLYNHDDVSKLADSLYLMLSELFTLPKIAIFIANRPIIEDILADLGGRWFQLREPEHSAIMAAAIGRARKVAIAYIVLCVTAVMAASFVPMLEGFQTLPTNVRYPYVDGTTSPAYQILFAFQLLYKPTSAAMHGTIETLSTVFMASAVAQLEMLAFNVRHLDLLVQRRFLKLTVEETTNAHALRQHLLAAEFRRCTEQHCFVIRYVRKIEAAYAVQTGMQFMLSAFILCLVGLQFFSIEDVFHKPMSLIWMILYTIVMVLEVYMVCNYGDEIICKSNHLLTASYESAWLDMEQDLKSSLVIFRERCQVPLSVRAGYLVDISLKTFTSLLRWSYNAFAVMNTMQP